MDLPFIERLVDLMGRAPIQELDLSKDGWRIRLTRAEFPVGDRPLPGSPSPSSDAAPSACGPESPANAQDDRHLVVAGLVGTFYRAPSTGSPPFVSVGDLVEEGQALGIMEAMKTLIKIDAECAGTISEILAEDGASVQAGDALFAISRVRRT